mmetsp:Transcript_1111/g.2730  ORF Transcript_1111/g.2730 Transcript_1111/m.2730 type:complete len:204 (+) Transcript_1111:563-1174(+)
MVPDSGPREVRLLLRHQSVEGRWCRRDAFAEGLACDGTVREKGLWSRASLRQASGREDAAQGGREAQQENRHAPALLEGPCHAPVQRQDDARGQRLCRHPPLCRSQAGAPRHDQAEQHSQGAVCIELFAEGRARRAEGEAPVAEGVRLVRNEWPGLPRAGHGPAGLRQLLCGLWHAHAHREAQDQAERHRGPALVHQLPPLLR